MTDYTKADDMEKIFNAKFGVMKYKTKTKEGEEEIVIDDEEFKKEKEIKAIKHKVMQN